MVRPRREKSVTKHGREEVVMLSAEEYKRLKASKDERKPTFAEMLLAIPQAPEGDDEEIFPRMGLKMRDIDL
jgi:antitoxin Phd